MAAEAGAAAAAAVAVRVPHHELCEGAWAELAECRALAEREGLRGKLPLLHLKLTFEELASLEPIRGIGELLAELGIDGLILARCLGDAVASVHLALLLAEEAAPAGASHALQFSQVLLHREEYKLRSLLSLLLSLRSASSEGEEAVAAALGRWQPEELLASGDFCAFWRENFPRRLHVTVPEFLHALQADQGLEVGPCQELLPWLHVGHEDAAGAVVQLPDAALLFDSLGVANAVAFCVHWEDLCGHALLAALAAAASRSGATTSAVLQPPASGLSAADLALARREERSCVLIGHWSRAKLQQCRPLLRALLALGASAACDAPEGLVVRLAEPEVVACLVHMPGQVHSAGAGAGQRSRSRLAEVISGAAHAAAGAEAQVHLEAAGSVTPSRCLADAAREPMGGADLHARLTVLKARKLRVLDGFHSVLQALYARRRAAAEQRILACDPSAQSEAVPKLQEAVRQQRAMEEQLQQRRHQLLQMERAYDHPDQVANICVLLQEVAEAEKRLEETRTWLAQQTGSWLSEDETFKQARRRRDLAWRQRTAAILLELKMRNEQRLVARAELTRIEGMLLDLEDSFLGSREDLHEYDLRLASEVKEKKGLLAGLTEAVARLRSQVAQAEHAALARAGELEALHQIMELQANKTQQLTELDGLEKKLFAFCLKTA